MGDQGAEKRKRCKCPSSDRVNKLRSSLAGMTIVSLLLLLLIAVPLIVFDVLRPGSAAEWFGAGGAVFAAWAALTIATRDRRERQQDRYDAARVQMRLVTMTFGQPTGQLGIFISNYGERPIFNVCMVRAEVQTHSAGIFSMPESTPLNPIAIVPAGGAESRKSFQVPMMNGSERWNPGQDADAQGAECYDVRIECSDVNGWRWELSNLREPKLLPKQPSS